MGKVTHTLLEPISGSPFVQPLFDLDLLDFRVSVLAKAYCLHLHDDDDNDAESTSTACNYRVVMSLNPNCPMLVIIFNGILYYYKLGGHGHINTMECLSIRTKMLFVMRIKCMKVAMEPSDLSDRILFVGEDGCFSVSTRDFPGCQGSCVYFCDEFYKWGQWNWSVQL